MLICNDCGETFYEDDVKIEYEHHPYGMGTATEEFSYCPHCGGDGIEEAHKCLRCGGYFTLDALEYIGNGLHCEVCADDLYG